MNEQFKLLAQQAKEESSQWIGSKPAITITYDELEKFAELIVKECLSMIENEASQYAEPVWAFELVNDIKDQFGVDE
jgi:hypothetical protein